MSRKRNYYREFDAIYSGSDAHHDTFPRIGLLMPEALLSTITSLKSGIITQFSIK